LNRNYLEDGNAFYKKKEGDQKEASNRSQGNAKKYGSDKAFLLLSIFRHA
jgi:hypothetical protein